jgi:hypothetical protein
MLAGRKEVYEAIDVERSYQDKQYGVRRNEDMAAWLLTLEKKIHDAKIQWYEGSGETAAAQLVQVAAVAVSAEEQP